MIAEPGWCSGSHLCCWAETPTSSTTLGRYAPQTVDHLHCQVLDPRHREVREHLADTCARLVTDYALDGLKIDFLDQAMVYRGTPSDGDLDDVGVAMQTLLTLVRERLTASGHGNAAVEFRQPYVSPAIGAYGQILRAGDCPGDAVVNRRSTIDARLLAVGQVVHGDMLMWGPTGGAGGRGPAALRLLVRGAPDLHAAHCSDRRAGRGVGRIAGALAGARPRGPGRDLDRPGLRTGLRPRPRRPGRPRPLGDRQIRAGGRRRRPAGRADDHERDPGRLCGDPAGHGTSGAAGHAPMQPRRPWSDLSVSSPAACTTCRFRRTGV